MTDESTSERTKRNRLEQLQAEVAELERAHHELTVEVAAAGMTADEAEAREAAARETHRALLRERGVVEPRRPWRNAFRLLATAFVVIAVFAIVLGTVVVTIRSVDAVIAARKGGR